MIRLRFDRVSKHFELGSHRHVALDDVSATFVAGSSTAIIGPNGAGKSTLLRIAAGVSAPTAGVAERVKRCVSLIELGSSFHPDLTGRENLEMALALHGVPLRKRGTASELAVTFSGIESSIDRKVKHYSSGMVARLAGAVAVNVNADLLLIDEVFAVGDENFQRRMLTRLTERAEQGATIVLVTHDMFLASIATTRTLWLEGGRVVRDGPTDEVLDEYVSTLGGVRRLQTDRYMRLQDATLAASSVEPGSPIELSADFEVMAITDEAEVLEWVLEFRSVAGTSAVWMRSPEERPEDRYLNLFATTAPVTTAVPRPGTHRMTFRVDAIPFNPTSLDITVIVRNRRGAVLDSLDVRLDVGARPDRPSLRLSARQTR